MELLSVFNLVLIVLMTICIKKIINDEKERFDLIIESNENRFTESLNREKERTDNKIASIQSLNDSIVECCKCESLGFKKNMHKEDYIKTDYYIMIESLIKGTSNYKKIAQRYYCNKCKPSKPETKKQTKRKGA